MRIINTADLITEEQIKGLQHNTREWVYNGLDTCVTLEIRNNLRKQLDNTTTTTYEFEKALQGPVLEMAMRGILVDDERRQKTLQSFDKQIKRLQDQLDQIVHDGIGFNIDTAKAEQLWWRSTQRLKNLFYDVMGLPAHRKRNANGDYTPTVDRDALEKLGSTHFFAEPITLHLLALRDLDKKRSWLRTDIDADGRMRSNFNIAGTNTGRLASSYSDFGTGGNLQNIDRELKSVFVADPGWKFANVDLEQGDARNVGAICWNIFVNEYGEDFAGSYLNACESGDLHTYNSRLIWPNLPWTGDIKADKKVAEQLFYRQDTFRQMSKKGGHGTNYYGTPRTMAKHLKMQTHVIEEFQVNYFRAYPVIGSIDRKDHTTPHWHNYVRTQLRDYHTLTTMFGRRRQFFGRSYDDSTLREAIAYEPQSMTADEIDTGLLRVWRANKVQVLCQVHDSLLVQYREEDEAEVVPWLIETVRVKLDLAKGRGFIVPTEAKIGWNWGDFSEENPDGLQKWKGGDDRKRTEHPKAARKFSLSHLL